MVAITAEKRKQLAILVLPILAIGSAKLLLTLPLARQYPVLAVIFFCWVVADSLCLAVIAKAGKPLPSLSPVLAALATASLVVVLGLPDHLRATLKEMPPLLIAMGTAVGVYLIWSATIAHKKVAEARANGENVWLAALGTVLPEPLVRFARAEFSLIHLALFSWTARPDVPPYAQGFSYHRYLAPMLWALLSLQLIEFGVVHLLVSLWSMTAALVLLAISVAGLIYLIGLIKSLRLRPILVTADGVRVRAGILIDHFIRFDQIDALTTTFSAQHIKTKTTFNASLLAWPNVLIRLKCPAQRNVLWFTRAFDAVAVRVDDLHGFLRAVDDCGQGLPIGGEQDGI